MEENLEILLYKNVNYGFPQATQHPQENAGNFRDHMTVMTLQQDLKKK